MLYSENVKITAKGIKLSNKHGNEISFNDGFGRGLRRFYNWWVDFKLLIVNQSGWCPSWIWRRAIYKLNGLKIGRGSKIHVFCRFFNPAGVEIGEGSVIGEFCFLDGRGKLKVGNHTDIASHVLIYNSKHDINDEGFTAVESDVEIGDYVFIGPRAIILPGVKIGRGAVVAAGAIVTKNVEPSSVVAGVPAKEIDKRKLKEFKYKLGRTRLFQ